MKNFNITISDEEEKALLIYMVDVQAWIDNAIHNRARQAIDQIISENTNKQPKKLSTEERVLLVNELAPGIKTAQQRLNEILIKNE